MADTQHRRSGSLLRTVLLYVALVVAAFIVLFPIYITVVNSLLPLGQILGKPPKLFPTDPQWGNYAEAFTNGRMARYLVNSAIVTTLIMVGQVGTSILAGYAFAVLRFPFKNTLFMLFLATLMLPIEVTLVANFQTIQTLGWQDTYQGLAAPFLAIGFGTFLMRQAFLGVPRDLRDAAALDGYGHFRFMARVAVPLVRPSVAALAVFSFLLAWNQYLWPLLITDDADMRTVQIGLRTLKGEGAAGLDVLFAGTVIAAIPIFVLLIVFQKQLVRGLTSGAVKG
ncbi:MAG: carbohydrate ABC transporter permease [Acidimicrobiia bacterium]|nr:carbohydrate ABC transporter permease [Acidimicrobiia bacterium]